MKINFAISCCPTLVQPSPLCAKSESLSLATLIAHTSRCNEKVIYANSIFRLCVGCFSQRVFTAEGFRCSSAQLSSCSLSWQITSDAAVIERKCVRVVYRLVLALDTSCLTTNVRIILSSRRKLTVACNIFMDFVISFPTNHVTKSKCCIIYSLIFSRDQKERKTYSLSTHTHTYIYAPAVTTCRVYPAYATPGASNTG